jgi:hypothetical protein
MCLTNCRVKAGAVAVAGDPQLLLDSLLEIEGLIVIIVFEAIFEIAITGFAQQSLFLSSVAAKPSVFLDFRVSLDLRLSSVWGAQCVCNIGPSGRSSDRVGMCKVRLAPTDSVPGVLGPK